MPEVLVIAAHPDDEVLGCGATIARHKASGDRVHVVIAGEGVKAREHAESGEIERLKDAARRASGVLGVDTLELHGYPDNRFDTVAALDLNRFVEEKIGRFSPRIVYTHHWGDANIDHRLLSECVVTACRPLPGQPIRTILAFEVPSSTGWLGPRGSAFEPNWYVDVSATMDAKIAALREYAGEMRDFPHARSIEAISSLSRWRGASVGMRAAEAFVLVRRLEM